MCPSGIEGLGKGLIFAYIWATFGTWGPPEQPLASQPVIECFPEGHITRWEQVRTTTDLSCGQASIFGNCQTTRYLSFDETSPDVGHILC